MDQNLASNEPDLSISVALPAYADCDGGHLCCGAHGFLCFWFFTDIINGVQEKCVLPPMDGYPHCEGKIKVRQPLCLFMPSPSIFSPFQSYKWTSEPRSKSFPGVSVLRGHGSSLLGEPRLSLVRPRTWATSGIHCLSSPSLPGDP